MHKYSRYLIILTLISFICGSSSFAHEFEVLDSDNNIIKINTTSDGKIFVQKKLNPQNKVNADILKTNTDIKTNTEQKSEILYNVNENKPLPDINFFGNLPYSTNIVTFLQKFNSYSTVNSIVLTTKGFDTKKASNVFGMDMSNKEKVYKDPTDETFELFMGAINFYHKAATLQGMKEISSITSDIKSSNIKGVSNLSELMSSLSNFYNINKNFLSNNISKIQNIDGNINLVYTEDIIVDIDEVVINNVPFQVQALFVVSIPYYQYNYKTIPKTANGIYWPHYLKELKLTSKKTISYYGDLPKGIINSYYKKYSYEKVDLDNYITLSGKNINININNINDSLVIIYTNIYDFYYDYLELVKTELENLENRKILQEQKQLKERYKNINMDTEI